MKGRPRIAPEIHKISGAYAKDPSRENKQAPLSDGQEPEIPDYLTEVERGKWVELVGDMRRMGTLSSDSRDMLIRYSVAFGGWMAARLEVAATGFTIEGVHGGTIRNPAMLDLHKFHDEMVKLLPEFGLTPASRSRLVSLKIEEDDPFQAWLAEAETG